MKKSLILIIKYILKFYKGLANSVRNAFVCPDVFMEPVLKPLNVLVMMDMREWFAINVWKILQNYITYK